jgi:periplasmic divalent cation tolerance protein
VIACANLVPGIESIYRWQGAVLDTREVLLVAKTSAARLAELERLLEELHPYEVPECVAIAPARVAPAYLAWLQAACAREDARS